MEKRDIEIRRNIIEKSLMDIKDYLKKNKRLSVYFICACFGIAIFVISTFVYYEKREKNESAKLDEIMDTYNKNKEAKIESFNQTIEDLKKLIDSSYWGFVNNNGYYIMANLYFSEKMYKDAKEYYIKFVDKKPTSFFAPLALQKAATACEYLNDYEGSFKIYQRLEMDYKDSFIADQTIYNLGRLYQKKGDIFKAREYYNKVLSTYPQSLCSQWSKRGLFLLGLDQPKNEKTVK
jgi:tetratricopeptide (TPR) repeat protein